MAEINHFSAAVVSGAGRGRKIGTPTLNLELTALPDSLGDGVYVCRASLDDGPMLPAVMHLGPRPVFNDSRSCEIHLLDDLPSDTTVTVTVSVLARLRDVQNFPSKEALIAQIGQDIAQARGILNA